MTLSNSYPKKYFVYVLKSLRDGNFYVGQTNNIGKRLALHNEGKVQSTRNRRPFKVVGCREFDSRNKARWIEHMLKKHGDRKKKFIRELMEASGPDGLLARRVSSPEGR